MKKRRLSSEPRKAAKAPLGTIDRPTADSLVERLQATASAERAAKSIQYMQAIPGGYGEGDHFLGNAVPELRAAAKDFADLPRVELRKAIQSKWHECRLAAVFILVHQFDQCRKRVRRGIAEPCEVDLTVDFYIEQLPSINNWDLVDSSSPKILGIWLFDRPDQRPILKKLIATERRGFGNLENMWKQRVAVLATMPLIKDSQFAEILELAEHFLTHPHDLMHKAVGWMLRELGKRDMEVLRSFLSAHASDMPRTMLRYSIEKMAPRERSQWLAS
ncbi:MAG: DNA alkylation repair protein [Aureliella sp.]